MVAFFLEAGLLLILLPWSSYWERNYFAVAMPWIVPTLVNPFVRGAVSGVGLLNLLAGFSELAPVFEPKE